MNFASLDILIILVYLGAILFFGLTVKNRENTTESYFLGNRSIAWYWIMFSIVATETSSLTFLGVPGISYSSNFNFLQLAIGFILGRIIVARYFIPLYLRGNHTSIYEWIGELFGKGTQKSMSSVFLLTRILGDGIRLYAVSIPVSMIFGNIFTGLTPQQTGILAIVIISVVTVIYSTLGGFRSVVTTDSIQFLLYMAGGIYSLWFLWTLTGEKALTLADFGKKTELFNLSMQGFFDAPYFFINAIFGGMVLSVGSHGVDQMIAQRALACHSESEAKKAMIGSGMVVFLQFLLFLVIGLLLYSLHGNSDVPKDQVFARFILEKIPSPFTGLIVAAILASAMSTFSSSINSLSLSVIADWTGKSPENFKNSRIISAIWGVVLMLSSLIPFFLSNALREGVVVMGLKIASLTLGPMTGIFILARFYRKRSIATPPQTIVWSLFLTIAITIGLSYTVNLAFTLMVPAGILLFLGMYYFLGVFPNQLSRFQR